MLDIGQLNETLPFASLTFFINIFLTSVFFEKLLVFLLFLLLFSACVIYLEYIPIKSNHYKVEDNSIIYENSNIVIKINGSCGRPVRYDLVSKFDIYIKSKLDSLEINFNEIKLVANENIYFKNYLVTGIGGESKQKYRLQSDKEYYFNYDALLTDSLLIMPEDNFKHVKLILDGLYTANNRKIDLPEFLFLTDSTEFRMKN